MLSINNISYFIGGRALYENASLHIKPKERIGLIGLNGKGKSTLLRMIDGGFPPDEGSISKGKDCTIGFLNQDLLSYQSEETILIVAMQAFKEAVETQKQIDLTLKKLETDYTDGLVDKLTRLQERFESLDGYTMQAKAEEILEGIGFSTSDLKRPLKEFSGGWRMRVMLAKLLLEKPSLLMLDEPTNHLDMPSIEWIENYLRTYEGAVIIVSHDRHFLENTTTRTVEVTHQQLVSYEGNYAFYLSEKAIRAEIQKGAFENQQQKIKQTERFIERFRAKATKSRQVQSRVKSLERMDMIEDVVDENAVVNFKFEFEQKSGRFLFNLEEVSKAYGEKKILEDTSIAIERGDKIALIGANGKGKSTILRIIAGTEPITGERKMGYNVNMAFYAQHQLESLNIDNEILEELKQAGSKKTELELRGILGCFLFSGDDVFKKIKVLSGGEKSRVALAKTLISEANFLMLDEPTNHLDMQSENILIQALQQYQGSTIFVSHNRHFVTEVANKIWYIENHQIKEYPGTYEEYLDWKEKNTTVEQTEKKISPKSSPKKEPKTKKRDNNSVEEKELKGLRKELTTLESEIDKKEENKKALENQMALPEIYEDTVTLEKLNKEYHQSQKSITDLTRQWEEIMLKIEALEN